MPDYQQQVNNMVGALGPLTPALWKDTMTTTGQPYNMSAHPLYYSPVYGKYVTTSDSNAAKGSVDFSSLKFGKKRKSKKSKRRSKKTKKHSRKAKIRSKK